MKKLFIGMVVLALAGCGSDSGSSSTSSGATKDKFGNCYGGTGQECTGVDEYTDCVTKACDAEYKDMLGDDFMNGNWGGKCKDYMTCNIACECGDTACFTKCLADATQDCQDAIAAIGTCVMAASCDQPVCKTTGGNGGANCDALKACCDKVMDAIKPACDAAVKLGDDNVCKQNLDSWKAGGIC
ncbi:MAG: hypothetical protein GXP54_05890 [Deltaproteobacteria bacterium]|nr:hypothetical protein [Deltaproteobacteria bacterium]